MDEYEYLIDKIDKEVEAVSCPLVDGSCDNMADYCTITGRIAGLRWFKNEIKDLRSRRLREDED